MSRFTAILRRVFGAIRPVLEDISINVVGPVLYEIERAGAKTDEERREIAKRVVQEYIAEKWPHYGWLTDRAVSMVFNLVRQQLRKRRK